MICITLFNMYCNFVPLAPPSPLVGLGGDMTEYTGHHTLPHRLSHQISRSGASSPPLPPPPPPEQDEHPQFGRPTPSSGAIMPIVPDEEDLPGWVPKNYIEKGRVSSLSLFSYLLFVTISLFICDNIA